LFFYVSGNTEGGKESKKRRSAVRNKGKRDSGERDERGDGEDIDKRLVSDPRGDASKDEAMEGVFDDSGGFEDVEDEKEVEIDDEKDADKASFFADDGQDGVGGKFGEEFIFLIRIG